MVYAVGLKKKLVGWEVTKMFEMKTKYKFYTCTILAFVYLFLSKEIYEKIWVNIYVKVCF